MLSLSSTQVGIAAAPTREMSRDELMTQMALIERQLQSSDESTADLVDALVDAARAARVPMQAGKDDTHAFIEGRAAVETATWAQCGGLIQALVEGYVVQNRDLAARVAQRVFELTPTHFFG